MAVGTYFVLYHDFRGDFQLFVSILRVVPVYENNAGQVSGQTEWPHVEYLFPSDGGYFIGCMPDVEHACKNSTVLD